MNQAKQPADHPAPEEAPKSPAAHNPAGNAPNGVPPEATAAEATGLPTSDRHKTEAVAHPDAHDGKH